MNKGFYLCVVALLVGLNCFVLINNFIFINKEPLNRGSTHSAFTPTLVAAYQELKKGEGITGREYLALCEMVREKEQEQLMEVATFVGTSKEEIISLMADTQGVLVQRQNPWDGNMNSHL